jgi:Glycosyltransferase family 87
MSEAAYPKWPVFRRSWVAAFQRSLKTPDGVFVAAAAAAFPPVWSLVLHGQTTVFPLAAFFLGHQALEKRRPFLAGAALGLMAVKPRFGLVLAFVVLSRRSGACSSAQWPQSHFRPPSSCLMGVGTITAYADHGRSIRQIEPLLEPNSWQMHSLC